MTIAYLLVSPIVVLNDYGGFGLFLLVLGVEKRLLATLVRSIGFLNDLGRLVQLPLLLIRQRQVAQVALALDGGLK